MKFISSLEKVQRDGGAQAAGGEPSAMKNNSSLEGRLEPSWSYQIYKDVVFTEVSFILHTGFHQLLLLIICILYTVLVILRVLQNTMTSHQHLMKTTSILIKTP